MSFSSIAAMLSMAQASGQPLHAVIRDADCQENGYDAAASHRQIAALWTAMQQSSRQYCAADRSNSGLIGGDAARLRAAAESGRLLGGTYFQRVTEEALKVAECNACMKRIVAAPTAGSCGVLPAVLIPLAEERDVPEETILEALYIAAGFGQVTALRASVAGAEGATVGCASYQIHPEIGEAEAAAVEIVSLAVKSIFRRRGIGRLLVKAAMERIAALRPREIVVLTFAPEVFGSLGFQEIPKNKIMHKLYTGCINCTKHGNPYTCPEIAMEYSGNKKEEGK